MYALCNDHKVPGMLGLTLNVESTLVYHTVDWPVERLPCSEQSAAETKERQQKLVDSQDCSPLSCAWQGLAGSWYFLRHQAEHTHQAAQV